jgi:diguanylate cyclase (GGDEF)-like protein/PAS domain S-box-containing protein
MQETLIGHQRISILIVDDDTEDISIIGDMLREGMGDQLGRVESARSFSEAMGLIKDGGIDICLLDYRLGNTDGIELIRTINTMRIELPIVVLTAYGDEDVAVAAMKAGAIDYIPKRKLSTELLCHAVRYAIELKRAETLRQQAERALRESETRYRELVENIPAIVCELRIDGEVLFINPAVMEITGYLPEELKGENWWQKMVSPEQRQEVLSDWNELRKIQNYELNIITKDRNIRTLSWSSTPCYDDRGDIKHIVCIGIDITEMIRLRERLNELALVDELTGLYNRRGFFTLVEQQIKMTNRSRKELVILFVDIDGMKLINDKLGHDAGDQTLRDAADVLRHAFRESDILGRIGGDEFAVCVTDAGNVGDASLTERLRSAVDMHNSRIHREFKLSLSFGFVRYRPDSGLSLSDLIRLADEHMYRAKKDKSQPSK